MVTFTIGLHLKLGLRLALMMLAVMGIFSWTKSPHASTGIERLRNATALLIAVGVLMFGITFLPAMLGVRLPASLQLGMELCAIAEMCVAMIAMIAARAMLRGVEEKRVKRSAWVNAAIAIAFVAGALVFG